MGVYIDRDIYRERIKRREREREATVRILETHFHEAAAGRRRVVVSKTLQTHSEASAPQLGFRV